MSIGSIPIGTSIIRPQHFAPVAQLDRASDYESEGYVFDSCRARQVDREVAQFGSASALGAEGRRFESCLPDQLTIKS